MSVVHQLVQAVQQLLNIREVEPCGGFVQDIQVSCTPLNLGQLIGQLDPLGLAARRVVELCPSVM
jgi:hypothetical protein